MKNKTQNTDIFTIFFTNQHFSPLFSNKPVIVRVSTSSSLSADIVTQWNDRTVENAPVLYIAFHQQDSKGFKQTLLSPLAPPMDMEVRTGYLF